MALPEPSLARVNPSIYRLPLRMFAAQIAVALLLGCAGPAFQPAASSSQAQLPTTTVVLPNGSQIEAELAMTPEEQATGMMFRPHLAPDRGMLFVGDRAAPRSFWMYQCLIPLDIIWLDGARRIVEIVRDAPPCRDSDPQRCPSYGGRANSVYVLELAAGQAAAQGLKLGDRLDF